MISPTSTDHAGGQVDPLHLAAKGSQKGQHPARPASGVYDVGLVGQQGSEVPDHRQIDRLFGFGPLNVVRVVSATSS